MENKAPKEKQSLKEKLVYKLKLVVFFFRLAAILFTIFYLGFLIATNRGNQIANTILLILAVAYGIFIAIITFVAPKKGALKMGKRVYRYLKLAVNAFSLGVTIYGLIASSGNATLASVMMAAISLAILMLKIMFEIMLAVAGAAIHHYANGLSLGVPWLEKFKNKKGEIQYSDQPDQIE